jgi:hypothetical protein
MLDASRVSGCEKGVAELVAESEDPAARGHRRRLESEAADVGHV